MGYVVPAVKNNPSSDNKTWNWQWSRDANSIISKLGWTGLGQACGAYVKGSQNKTDYFLPHHKLINGKLTLVRGGVRAAMQRLKSTKLPATVKLKIYSHLAAHYRHFGDEAPKYKEIFTPEEVDDLIDFLCEEM